MAFGDYGLKSMAACRLSEKQIEAARRSITRYTKRGGKLWIRVFPDKPVTQKVAGSPMGSGKGDVKGYVAVVTPGKIIFELAGVSEELSRGAFDRAAHKLPVKTRIITKED